MINDETHESCKPAIERFCVHKERHGPGVLAMFTNTISRAEDTKWTDNGCDTRTYIVNMYFAVELWLCAIQWSSGADFEACCKIVQELITRENVTRTLLIFCMNESHTRFIRWRVNIDFEYLVVK